MCGPHQRQLLNQTHGSPTHCGGETLVEFSYVSRQSRFLGSDTLREIALKSWHNNRRLGITGYLRYDGTRFYQEMCGDARAVSLIAAAILADIRHDRIEMQRYGLIGSRRFETWRLEGFEGVLHPFRASRSSRAAPRIIHRRFDTAD